MLMSSDRHAVSPDAPAIRSQSRHLDRDSFVAQYFCRADFEKFQEEVIHRQGDDAHKRVTWHRVAVCEFQLPERLKQFDRSLSEHSDHAQMQAEHGRADP
jgi:hypothetical protein